MAIRYPAAWLDELRSRADLVQVVSAYVPLKRNGRKYWGLCPFHGEKTASFSVDPERQLYYCFGCKAGGTVINFVMDMERLDFREAVQHLADQVHMPVPQMEEDPEYQKRKMQRERLLECNREAARYYHETLFTPAGEAALNYLKGRGLTDAVIRRFGLGAAPDQWDSLTRFLKEKGYTQEEIRLAGLCVVKPERPDAPFDMFRNRAMFPIIDQYGNVLAFGGRVMEKREPKYLNTSDTPVFNKRLGVYAANLLRKERHLERVVLVEGYMDVVSLRQFGVEGVCATLGTALTPEQARLLKRFAPKVYLAYDGDGAGQHAILRGLDILEAENIPARVLDFPDGLDPDEFIRRDGPEGFAKLPALTPAAYRIRRLRDSFDLSTQDGRTEYARQCAPILKKLDPLERENHLRELAVQTGFTREILMAQIGVTETPAPQPKPEQTGYQRPRREETGKLSETQRAEEVLISILATGTISRDMVSEEEFEDPELKEIYRNLAEGVSPEALVEAAQGQTAARERLTRLLMTPAADNTDEMLRMAQECKATIRKHQLKKKLAEQIAALSGMPPEQQREAMKTISALQAELKEKS